MELDGDEVVDLDMNDFIEEVIGRFTDLFRQTFGQYPGPFVEAIARGVCLGQIALTPDSDWPPPLNQAIPLLRLAWGQTELAFWYFPPSRPF